MGPVSYGGRMEPRWPSGRSRDGGVDRVPLGPPHSGFVWLCGKHAIAPDVEGIMETHDVTTVVCLVEDHEIMDRYPSYAGWLRDHEPVRAVRFPVPDLSAPAVDDLVALLDDLVARIRCGERLMIHCAAGFGRTGTVVACLLIRLGVDRDEALRRIARHRPMAGPEVGEQQALVDAVAALVGQ